MVTEIALLQIKENQSALFEAAFEKARSIIAGMKGCLQYELQKCVEEQNKYLLIVRWEKLEDHTEGFRKSEEYGKWKALLHHFYEPFPTVEHYTSIF